MSKEYIERGGILKRIMCSPLMMRVPGLVKEGIADLIEKYPAADVVEVVRCGKCIFAKPMTKTEKELYSNECIVCLQLSPYGSRIVMSPDSYCSYGERKDGAE